MSSTFRFVIAGTGNISRTYWNAVKKLPGIDIVGFISRSGNKPGWLPEDVFIEAAQNFSEIKSDFDGVILCTPNGMHYTGAIEAAKLGKHVLTEKSIGISLPEIDEMISTCKANNVKLGVAYQRRMSPDNQVVKQLLEKQKLGRVYAADLTVKNYRDDAYYNSGAYRGSWKMDGGGPFMQQAAHQVDLYGWFFGKPERIVSCYGTFAHDIETEDHGAAILRHKDGMIGTMIASTVAKPGFDARLEIICEKGTVIMENDIITTWAVDNMENPSRVPGGKIHSGASSASVEDTSGHEAIISDFVAAVREDRDPCITGESARLATEIILGVYSNNIS
ncbi:MAG TPA: Gfo/Idh/MocA family oxidoreductase [Balneolales bacterium]|nr:Gfo/Idh/MocA family oxidoreductase [Balneolales bacterium]